MVAEGEALPAFFHDKCADSSCSDIRSGYCKNYICVRHSAVGYENLAAVKYVVISLENCHRLCAACIASRIRLGKAEGAYLFTLCQRHQIFLFLFFCTEGSDWICA